TMHGIANYGGMMGTLQRIYEGGVLRTKPQITHYVALTNADVEFLSRYGVERERISIIPNAVDSSYWKPDSNLPERQKDILFVGSLIKRKRPDLLIEAFRDYSTIVKDSHLHIVGDGPELENIRRQINDYNLAQSVSLLGRIPLTNLLQLYQHSDLLVLPSIAEGLPTVLLEAMACGTIPIATDLPGNRDVIQNERNGLLFQLDDKESLLRSLLYTNSLSNENRQRIRESAIETVRTQFSWNSVSNKMVSLYEMILENHLKQ
ncbi:MAG: glycosyltransferase family 4 protein, partial [Candidatus Thorarchaeota archaeon]